ncbi:hypothetical protein JCM25156A_24880 [Komagataeibacter kakiaceti JCM 25156]|uniref:hypothetical protein n=1 Tax=Komagataeibacter kakiaceti TaxID=943261 RepID=UPI0011DE29EE|nr:hypothetical protein [Komagataeibacter kakiaceti]
MNIRPPAQIDWLVAAVGAQAALSFIESAGGRRLWVPAKWVGSAFAATYGGDIAVRVGVDHRTVVRTQARYPKKECPRRSWRVDTGQMNLF